VPAAPSSDADGIEARSSAQLALDLLHMHDNQPETKWIMDYALFPVLAQVEDTLLAFLRANAFHPSLGQVTIHLHWVPYYLR
jgi:hypothetical protein